MRAFLKQDFQSRIIIINLLLSTAKKHPIDKYFSALMRKPLNQKKSSTSGKAEEVCGNGTKVVSQLKLFFFFGGD